MFYFFKFLFATTRTCIQENIYFDFFYDFTLAIITQSRYKWEMKTDINFLLRIKYLT